jgi:hypothetical protein
MPAAEVDEYLADLKMLSERGMIER